MSYRGFSMNDVLALSEENGQAEAMSKTGAKGLSAAKEWIDNYWGKVTSNEKFPWHVYERLLSRDTNLK